MVAAMPTVPEAEAERMSWALLAFLSGAVTMLRGLADKARAQSLADDLKTMALRILA
jgi:hypothetical protein